MAIDLSSMLLLIPLAPLLLLVAMALPGRRVGVARLAPVAVLPAVVVALGVPVGSVQPLPGAPWAAGFGLDEPGRWLLLLGAVVWGCAAWFATGWFREAGRMPLFMAFFLAAMAGFFGLVIARDLPTFYLFFALMGFAGYGLVVHDGSWAARRAGRLYLAMLMLGEISLFAGVALAASQAGELVMPGFGGEWRPTVPTLALLAVGFAIKAGVLGLHAWLPVAHPAAPVPASAVLSGLMIKAGVLGWWRVWPEGAAPAGSGEVAAAVMALGVAAALYGAVVGVWQGRAKTVLAFSSVSQIGWLTLLTGVAMVGGGKAPLIQAVLLFFLAHHALAKAALFLGAGLCLRARGVMARRIWWGLWLPALALAGAPLTSGLLAKEAVETALEARGLYDGLGPWLLAASLGTTLLMGRFLWLLYPRGEPTPAAVPGPWRPWAVLTGAGLVLPWVAGAMLPAFPDAIPQPGGALPSLGILLAGGGVVVTLVRWPRERLLRRLARLRRAVAVWRRQRERRLRHWWRRGQTRALARERQLQEWPLVGRGLMLLGVLLWLTGMLEGIR